MRVWRYLAGLFSLYFVVLALAFITWVTTLPQVRTGAEWTTNSTATTWFSDMSITIPIVMFWIAILTLVAFVIHAIIGIAKGKYKDFGTDAKIDKLDAKFNKIMTKLGIDSDDKAQKN